MSQRDRLLTFGNKGNRVDLSKAVPTGLSSMSDGKAAVELSRRRPKKTLLSFDPCVNSVQADKGQKCVLRSAGCRPQPGVGHGQSPGETVLLTPLLTPPSAVTVGLGRARANLLPLKG